MNVEYKCPECGSRLFAVPKGTPGWIQYKCRLHTDTNMEQVEEFLGPNFAYVDEDEINPSKTGVQTIGTTASRITPAEEVVKKLLSPEDAAKAELEHLRRMYGQVTAGKKPHSQWKAPRLRKEIESEEAKLNDRLEYFGLVDRYKSLTGGDQPSEQWGIAVLRSRVNLLQIDKDNEQEMKDA